MKKRTSIQVAAVQLYSTRDKSPAENRWHALSMLEQAAQRRPDLIVMPEAVTMLCYPDGRPNFSYTHVSEPVPGPTTDLAAGLAKTHNVNVVIGLIADRGSDQPCQSVAVVINRRGKIVGIYDKTHEPEVCRTDQAAARGTEFPVFDLDFGRLGVFMCYDLLFPEVAAILALKGARLLCLPHLITLPSPRNFAVQVRARAIDNVVPIIAAGQCKEHEPWLDQDGIYPTCMIDANGETLAQSRMKGSDIVTAAVSLQPVLVDNLGLLETQVNWNKQRRRELRPTLYAREYVKLEETLAAETEKEPRVVASHRRRTRRPA